MRIIFISIIYTNADVQFCHVDGEHARKIEIRCQSTAARIFRLVAVDYHYER